MSIYKLDLEKLLPYAVEVCKMSMPLVVKDQKWNKSIDVHTPDRIEVTCPNNDYEFTIYDNGDVHIWNTLEQNTEITNNIIEIVQKYRDLGVII